MAERGIETPQKAPAEGTQKTSGHHNSGNDRRSRGISRVGALKGRSEKASKEKMVSSDKQKEQTVSGEKALEAGTKNTETASKDTLAEAELLASQYNYDKAIDLLKKAPSYDSDKKMQAAAKKYEDIKATCTAWPLEKVTHVFYHILIKDPSKAFDGDYKEADYNQVMTTIDEFNKITQTMYDKGYVMVSIKDMAKADDNGNITEGEILLPPGKTPFVLSQDDVCYYHYMDGDGYATKLIVDDKGKIRNEYVEDDGSVSVGDYDMVPLIDRFVEKHPDFSYRGAKGILHLPDTTGSWDIGPTKAMRPVRQIWMKIKYSGWMHIRISAWKKNGQPQKRLPMP